MLIIPTLFCPKAWEDMAGDETQRFCAYCNKHVHNLEALSASERLALLCSPAASICSRYKVAIRRPVPGKEESYFRHLIKCGTGVAVAGSVLLVLWEMHGRSEKEKYYQVAATHPRTRDGMPGDLYREHQVIAMGEMDFSFRTRLEDEDNGLDTDESTCSSELKLDATQIDRLIEGARPTGSISVPIVNPSYTLPH